MKPSLSHISDKHSHISKICTTNLFLWSGTHCNDYCDDVNIPKKYSIMGWPNMQMRSSDFQDLSGDYRKKLSI